VKAKATQAWRERCDTDRKIKFLYEYDKWVEVIKNSCDFVKRDEYDRVVEEYNNLIDQLYERYQLIDFFKGFLRATSSSRDNFKACGVLEIPPKHKRRYISVFTKV
jgi:hypothetical protein